MTADHEHGGRRPDVSADSAAVESFNRLTATSLPQGAESLARRIGVDQRDVERRKAFLELTGRDTALLTTLHARLAARSSSFAERFYAHLSAFEEMRSLLSDAATVERLKRSQTAYFDSLTAGNYAGDYVQDRIRVGETHHRIGLGPKWYLGAYSRYLCELMGVVWESAADDVPRAVETARALVKVVFFDIGLTLDTYHQIDRWTIEELQAHAQRIVNNIPSGVLVLSADLRVLFANQAFVDFVGRPSDRVMGMPLEAFFPTHRWWDRVARLLGIGESRSQMDVELVNAHGTRQVRLTLVPISRTAFDADHAGQDRARLLLVLDDLTEQKQAETALRESQRSVSTLISNLPGLVYRCANDPERTIEYISEGVREVTGFAPEDFARGRVAFADIIHPEDREQVWDGVRTAVAANAPYSLVYRVRTANDDERWVAEHGRAVYGDNGSLLALEGFIRDVTDQKRMEMERQDAETALRESEARYRNLVENAHDMIQSIGPDGQFLFVNQAWLDTMGYRKDEVPGITLSQAIHPDSLSHCQALFERVKAGDASVLVEAVFVAKDGRAVPVQGSATGRYVDGRLVATHAIFRNMGERREWEARLAHVTRHDHLTNLPNRTVFMDRLDQALARVRSRRAEQPVAVLILDLDRFKLVNDTFGHEAGDRMLLAVAERLGRCLREGDTVARLGGDEFAILLPEVAKVSDTVVVVEKIFAALGAPFVIDAHELFVSASIGISVAPDDGDQAGIVLKNADAAMYRAKDQGRNTYQLYSPAMNVSQLERLSLESNLRHALERDEFVVYYQPQVELRTGRLIGMEALVRWRHPELGLVSPAQFIPVAEETGLIIPIGERVLSLACAQNRRWQEQGIAPFSMSVNLSARQFQQPDLNSVVDRVLRDSGLDPRWLDLELTESLLMSDSDRTVSTLNAFHAMGVGLTLDDFGTGYSSLSYLKRYPIDTIKIDQSFVRHITTDADDAAIAVAITAMAHSLKLTVVAEGVETEEQQAFLAQQGCDAIQGYLLSRPLPADEITAWLNDRAARGGEGQGPARLPHAA